VDEMIIYKDESYKIMGACFEVYREMGCGFLEPVYQECLEKEFTNDRIPYISQQNIKIKYKGELLDQTFRPDFVCYQKIILEIKAVSELIEAFEAQILNYLNASKYKLGILINFGHHPKLEYKRFVL
jgi:GxxExxY protein